LSSASVATIFLISLCGGRTPSSGFNLLKPQEANGTGREIGLLHMISVLMILLKQNHEFAAVR
jgi:hypothetical protein